LRNNRTGPQLWLLFRNNPFYPLDTVGTMVGLMTDAQAASTQPIGLANAIAFKYIFHAKKTRTRSSILAM
jgi:hypothetical protein